MQNYVGYGFDTNEITNKDWLELFQEYDKERQNLLKKETKGLNKEETNEAVSEFIENLPNGKADYLARIINREEHIKAGTDYIVSAYGDYLVFDSCRFAYDSLRTKYIKSQEDYYKLIKKYIDIREIHFGNLYEGTDFYDPVFELR